MSSSPRIAFIGAGSTVFMKNILGDILLRPELASAQISLMDIDARRLDESARVLGKMIDTLGVPATVTTHSDRRAALSDADFVIVAFQIGGFEPCTVTDFDLPKSVGLRQTIADTLGVGGIMRGLRTVPELWAVCADMMEVCPKAILLQYVNPMAINTWAIAEKFPEIRQVGLCHSVQGTAAELASDLQIPLERIRYRCAGINHVAFYLEFEELLEDGSRRDLYPALKQGWKDGVYPRPETAWSPRCPNKVRYEMLDRLGYFVTESSEHFAEYVPWFIKRDRPDLIERYGIPLDEYPKRCVDQINGWQAALARIEASGTLEIKQSHEYASQIVHAVWTDTPAVIYGNLPNVGQIPQLPMGSAVEVPCLVDGNGIQPTTVRDIPPQLIALMQSNINVQALTVAALVEENRDHVYHAAMMDPHTGAELDLDQIWQLVDQMIAAHGDWMPAWLR